jgi:hypothetical protein
MSNSLKLIMLLSVTTDKFLSMDILFNRPNLLFLIIVRNQKHTLLTFSSQKLLRPIYRTKLIKALTVYTTNEYGTQYWYLNGFRHREDGPAIIYSNGEQNWYLNGLFHREDGPAVIYPNGTQEWYINGKCHREDGPAIIYSDGTQYWYLNGFRQHDNFKLN